MRYLYIEVEHGKFTSYSSSIVSIKSRTKDQMKVLRKGMVAERHHTAGACSRFIDHGQHVM